MTLILSRHNIENLLNMEMTIEAVTEAFFDHGNKQTRIPDRPLLKLKEYNGMIGIMPAYMERLKTAGVKLISHHQDNHKKNLPESMGLIVYYDPATGIPLCIMDCAHITKMRTGAATAVSVKYLAKRDSRVLGLVGAGAQAKYQIAAVSHFCDLIKVKVFDIKPAILAAFRLQIEDLGLAVEIVDRPEKTCFESDILITCTTSHIPFIKSNCVGRGMHIAAVGADMPHKRELSPEVYALADKWVTDLPNQAIKTGEIKDMIAQGSAPMETLHGTLGEIVAGRIPGRENENEITIFKSTGMAVQDVAVAKKVYELAMERKIGLEISITP